MQPPARSHLPPLKAASQLLKYHPTSALPGRCDPATSRLPMTRQRTQTEAVKLPAPSAPGITGISSSYNLRPTTTASKQPNTGLPRPPLSSIPSGLQRPAPGLRPPSAKSNLGPAAANPGTKITQPKKRTFIRGEPLPTPKRKKTDGPVPSSSGAETSTASDAGNGLKNPKRLGTSCNQRVLPAKAQRDDAAVPVSAAAAENMTSCNAASRIRNQKLPVNHHRSQLVKPQGHGCARCVVLEEQLKTLSAENKRLKEELLKYSQVNKEKNDACANESPL
ncbi:arginine-glutamic acid dipeptide repeats protein-like [Limanda limanda]|uniref:arginine-glutamic acid dipeptide repeats protein-like n=1 Tax=Limanda limanda TaxID=27771 RepID=UPI0029C6ABD6|nr:arginine-glutamic acid dipeptide repeats protein-like [Limanda limanda]